MKRVLLILGLMMNMGASGQCWKIINTSFSHNLGIKSDGTLWVWGLNQHGNLGVGDLLDRHQPTQIGNDTNWSSVSAGGEYHSLAIKTNGTLWAWGLNSDGQLGNGTYTRSLIPIRIGLDTNWKTVSGGSGYSVAIKKDNTLWTWGLNNSYQLSLPSTISKYNKPLQYDSSTNWESAYAGSYNIFALKTDSTLWGWGGNFFSQLGVLNTAGYGYPHPIQIDSNSKWVSIAAKYSHSAGIKKDGSLWTWGQNLYGQIGDSSLATSFIPKQIGKYSNWKSVSVGWGHTIAVRSDNTLWAWGYNTWGSLGDGTTTDKYYPTKIGNNTNWSFVSAGHSYSISLKSDGNLWSWGFNGQGQLGNGTTIDKLFPINIFCPTTPLPLKLLSFTTKLQTPNNVLLNWQTTNQISVSHINIQRSINGKDFTTIGKVNVGSVSSYSFLDEKLPITHDKLTLNYRLEIVDKDGSKTYSTIQQITIKPQTANIALFPNPAISVVTVACAGAKEIMIVDYLGKIVVTKKIFNNQYAIINVQQFAKGIYLVKAIMANGNIKMEKLIVK